MTENGHTKVLVVDDDAALLRMLRLWLSSAGMDVATAYDGVDALDKLSADGFDVVVLDLQMPRMDGRSVCREMTSRGLAGKVVILSAYGAEEARRELGADAAISKPFDPEVLIETVQDLAHVA